MNESVMEMMKNKCYNESYRTFLVLWIRAEPWMDPEALAEMYLEGRSRKTFPTYNCAFRKLWVHSV